MLVRIVSAAVAATLALGLYAVEAQADHRKKHQRVRAYDQYYAGPDFVKGVPGLRLFFGDYALTREEYDALYGEDEDSFDESYYLPDPIKPAQRKKATDGRKATAPSQDVTTASISRSPKLTIKPRAKPEIATKTSTASATQSEPASGAGLSCAKAGDIVSGFGFTAVKPETCNGKVYAFNATRDGNAFAIKLDSSSGELTEVKKLR